MSNEIKPGQWVQVKVTKRPRAQARLKTLIRLFEKDSRVCRERTRLRRSRPTKWHRRGGRPWGGRSMRLPVVQTTPGATYKIFASVDVLRDLKSVKDYVEVTQA